ncbi:Hpt domain-containing protein [Burkholderia sp. GAS332]|jgi:HPt (histidine-containing phosphotransfer) domain-containing protein|nr:Hpt domain-containing protein [Burkholderia sp. GAS332]
MADTMQCAILVSTDSAWGQTSGLSAMLARLGFKQCEDAVETPGRAALALVRCVAEDRYATPAVAHPLTGAHSMRFAVVPADISTSVRAALAECFDGVLTEPVNELDLCEALASRRYIALAPGERVSLRTKVLELACGDDVTAVRLLHLIIDTNRTTLTQLCDKLKAGSWEEVSSAAHRIAGSARMLDCFGLIALLTRLEAAAREREAALATALLSLVVDALESLDVSMQEALEPVGQQRPTVPFLERNPYRYRRRPIAPPSNVRVNCQLLPDQS